MFYTKFFQVRLRESIQACGFGTCLWIMYMCCGIGACGHTSTERQDSALDKSPAQAAKIPEDAVSETETMNPGKAVGKDFWHATVPPSSCDAKAWPSVWSSLVGAPGEGRRMSELWVQKSDDTMELHWQENNLPDDSIAAIAHRYFLRWNGSQGWELERCEKEILRCWRGSPRAGVCP